MNRVRAPKDEGFALLEALAVLLLSALVLHALMLAVSLVTRSSAAASRGAATLEELATGLAALRRDFSQIAAVKTGAAVNAPLLFYGSDEALGLAIRTEAQFGGDQLVWIAVRSKPAALTRSSVVRVPGAADFERARSSAPIALFEGAWRWRFSFAEVTERGTIWSGSWIAQSRLPDIVQLQIWDRSDERRAPLTLMISPHVDSPSACGEGDVCRGGGNAAR